MTAVIEARGLARWYGQVVGVNDVDALVGPGITGLLGPNGAGKSTFLRLVSGQIKPSRGEVRALGLKPFANRELFQRLGFCPDQDALYDDMTGLQFVSFMMRLHGFGRAESHRRAHAALDRVGLTDARGRRTGGYSKGMRQRARLAQAIAHEPELLVLDEPLNGLDPLARKAVMGLLAELRDRGVHILVSSHVLHEVESMTRTVILLFQGRAQPMITLRPVRLAICWSATGSRPPSGAVVSTIVPPPRSRNSDASSMATSTSPRRRLSLTAKRLRRSRPSFSIVTGPSAIARSSGSCGGAKYGVVSEMRCSWGRTTPRSSEGTGPVTEVTTLVPIIA